MSGFKVQLINQDIESNSKTFALNLAFDLQYFDGHFQDKPILAAVAQLHLIDRMIKQYFDASISFDGMKQLKFMSPIVPEQGTILHIKERGNHSFSFEFKTDNIINSKGIMCYQGYKND